MPSYDFVFANKIETFCRIGCSEEERSFPQRLMVSVKLGVDTREAARTADLTKTVNYATVCDRVRAIGAARPWVLVEELAEVCAEKILAEFPLVHDIRIVIEKFILPGVESVGCEIHRGR
jgi:dihydroneopterin aldolase